LLFYLKKNTSLPQSRLIKASCLFSAAKVRIIIDVTKEMAEIFIDLEKVTAKKAKKICHIPEN